MYAEIIFLLFCVPPVAAGAQDVPGSQEVIRVPGKGAAALEYRRTGVPFKPYVVQLRTPSGVNVVRDNVPDHRHHHGLMFAWRVDGVNFWEELPDSGKQRSERTRILKSGFMDTLTWLSPAGKALLQEERRVETAASGDPQATLVSWRSEFMRPSETSGPANIAGSHYFGLGMRFLESMDGGTFTVGGNDAGEVFRGEERLLRGPWCAYTARVDGKDVTVAMFDHPQNPRPVTWFAMPRPFGYMAATLRLHETPLELPAGKPLVLRYGVAVWDGRVDAKRIDAVCRAWLRLAGRQ